MLRLALAKSIAEQYQEKGIVHLPDFIIYQFDEVEYQLFWRTLMSTPRHKLYTDGFNVFRVNWFWQIFESFKGWLGFVNHCHPERIEMTLAKIAYAGYLKGFKSKELNESTTQFPVSMRFIKLINNDRTNEASKELQRLLMEYFINHVSAFPELSDTFSMGYPFGQTLINEYLAYLVPSLDPQDSRIIKEAIHQINYYVQWVCKTHYFKSSPFAEAYAHSLATQGKFYEALEWSSEVKYQFVEPYIDFYFSQENSDKEALPHALELIGHLYLSTIPEDKQKAIDYIKNNFDYEEQANYLTRYPELRNGVAKSYLDAAKIEKSKWRITRLFTGNQTLEYLAQAVSLEPTILVQDNSMEDIMLQEEWNLYLFENAMQCNRFEEADSIFTDNTNLKIDKYKLEPLREYYLKKFAANESQIKEALLHKNTKTARQYAEEQMELAKKIVRIKPNPSTVMQATSTYSSTILAIDELDNPIKQADREQLSKAQHYMSEFLFLSNNNNALIPLYNKIQIRKIECFVARLGVPIDYNSRLSTRTDFVREHFQEIEALKKELKAYIHLNEFKSKDRQLLAKMYYLLADTLVYFEEKKQESIPYFKKAKELMPENHYYNLRFLEMTEDDRRHSIRDKIDNLGFLHGTKYNDYMSERWCEEKILSTGFDIHAVIPDDSFFTTLGRVVGF
ncbi:Uncharacterised protein [Legionella wadsworthii]|uniref:Uncharacterized protein n=1 Tax=Legionella wadsworthii TaxID=28088 RepID=A0A378LN48_9GAMM|nr:hypothetical protein [Legionella wadsworthii]STY28174.1 Uncharacterised protein [Legionella wadsworthii]